MPFALRFLAIASGFATFALINCATDAAMVLALLTAGIATGCYQLANHMDKAQKNKKARR